MTQSNITFRSLLLGSVSDFCLESGLSHATPEKIADLVVRLARYKEEGFKLTPQVYLTNNIRLMVNMLPAGELVHLSTTSLDSEGIEEMLKVCAPLAKGEWNIFGNLKENEMEYGVFRGSGSPVSISVDDVILSDQDSVLVVKAHHIADECVFIRSSKGGSHNIFLNLKKQDSPPPLQYVDDLIEEITRCVKQDVKEPVQNFLKKILLSILSKSHGCIIAVTNMTHAPAALSSDAIMLSTPIDFTSLVRHLANREGSSSQLQQSIRSNAGLLEGMICSDGITLFDDHGRVLGYRCFVKPSSRQKVIGGARKRAFETLKGHIGRGLVAAFIQSHDGWTDFEEKSNV